MFSPLFGGIPGQTERFAGLQLRLSSLHGNPLSDVDHVCRPVNFLSVSLREWFRHLRVSRQSNPTSCLLSFFLTLLVASFLSLPVGLEVWVFPYWERPWVLILKSPTSVPRILSGKSLTGASRVRPDGENGPRCNLEPLPLQSTDTLFFDSCDLPRAHLLEIS